MTEQAIRKFLTEEFPWYVTDAGVSMLRTANNTDELRTMTITAGRDGRLPINPKYEAAVREYFSIYAFEEYHGQASRQKIYQEKKRKDEAAELAGLRAMFSDAKYGSKIIDAGGIRRKLESLTLSELRKAKADVENHKRMKGMSASDLRAEYIANHPTPARRLDGYPILPQQMVLPAGLRIGDRITDGIHAVTMTPELIHEFSRANSSSAEWHFYRFRLVRAYGAGQVSERQQVSIPTGAGEGQ